MDYFVHILIQVCGVIFGKVMKCHPFGWCWLGMGHPISTRSVGFHSIVKTFNKLKVSIEQSHA